MLKKRSNRKKSWSYEIDKKKKTKIMLFFL